MVLLAFTPIFRSNPGSLTRALQHALSSFGSLEINPLTPFSIISGIMQFAVDTTAQPQAIASKRTVGTGECKEVLRKTLEVL